MIRLSPPQMTGGEREALSRALDHGWIGPGGPECEAFERAVADRVRMPHAIATVSGSAALRLALLAAGVGAGDRVWCSTLTFVATANAIVHVGATPVFVDCDASWQIDAARVRDGLDAAARIGALPKAVIGVHLFGECFDAMTIGAACKRHGVAMIEDACQALGSTYNGRPAGGFGDFAVFSFNANKIVTTGGGGMLLSGTSDAHHRAVMLASQGLHPGGLPWRHSRPSALGHNLRMSGLCAAVGRAQLADLDRRVAVRRELGGRYRALLADRAGWNWQPANGGNGWLASATIDHGPDFAEAALGRLQAAGVEARPVFLPMHEQPIHARAPRIGGENASRIAANGLSLPSAPQTDVDAVVGAIRS